MKELTLADMDVIGDAFEKLGEIITETNKANGWEGIKPEDWHNDSNRIPASLCLMHSEISEALEAFRKQDVENFKEEMVDIFIRWLDLLHGLGLEVAPDLYAKMEKNKKRAYKHGGKKI